MLQFAVHTRREIRIYVRISFDGQVDCSFVFIVANIYEVDSDRWPTRDFNLC